jgi:NADH-quinone oxidoreductase subunit M
VLTIVGATGVVLGAVYMLWAYQRVVFGPITREENKALRDLSWREALCLVPLCVLVFAMGIYPKPFLSRMHETTDRYLAEIRIRREQSYRPVKVAVTPAPPRPAVAAARPRHAVTPRGPGGAR